MRKKILERKKERLLKRKADLLKRSEESEDIAEVRAINEQLIALSEDLQDIADELEALAADDNNDNQDDNNIDEDEKKSAIPDETILRNADIFASFLQRNTDTRKKEGVLDSIEYREAFAAYVRTGSTDGFSQLEKREDEIISTEDIGRIIPNTVMQEFIKELKVYGNLYNKVRKLNVRGGVEFPIEELVPTVTWIAEKETSSSKKAPEYKNSVKFGYYICEARISQSLLSSVVSLAVLESEIARILAEAFVKEFDRIIINGTGTGQPLGILNDSRIKKDNKVAFTDEDMADWVKWRKNLFSKIPLAYRGQGIFVMTANTWENYIMTLKDANNRPLGKEVFTIEDSATTCRFAGREVVLVEPDIIKDYDAAATGEAFAVYFKPTNYAINSNLQLGFKRYFNEDTNKWINKGLAIVDGKLLDTNGVYVLTK